LKEASRSLGAGWGVAQNGHGADTHAFRGRHGSAGHSALCRAPSTLAVLAVDAAGGMQPRPEMGRQRERAVRAHLSQKLFVSL